MDIHNLLITTLYGSTKCDLLIVRWFVFLIYLILKGKPIANPNINALPAATPRARG